jgi:hypothetical protein
MTKQKVSKVRLAVNGIGCLGIALLCLPVGLPGLIGLISGSLRMGSDPDGGDKVLAIQFVCVVIGAIALVSLIRTVKAWREWPKA